MDNLSLLLKSSYTKSQTIRNLGIIKDFLEYWLFHNLELKTALIEFTKVNPNANVLESLNEQFYQQFTKTNVSDALNNLEKQISQLKILTICLPMELPESDIDQLGQHIRLTFQTPLLIEFKLDPNLIAGPAFIFNGVYKDYSIRYKIEQNRNLIIETLKKGVNKT